MIIKNQGKSGKRTILICQNCNQEYSELNIKIRQKGSKFCCNDCYKEFRSKNKLSKTEIKERNKIYQKKSKYKLDEEEYKQLFIAQDNTCLICDKKFSDQNKAHVDHDHITGKVRGLLCTHCNSLLGFANDNISILLKAIDYLKKG